MAAAFLALVAAACFGTALVVGRLGLRHATPLVGGSISVTVTTVILLLVSPLSGHLSPVSAGGLIVFAAVGLFYPAVVMLLSYESNRVLGPTLTGAAASTTPLFAAAAAAAVLGERIAAHVLVGAMITVAGLLLLVRKAPMRAVAGWRLALPLSGAALRGTAQMLIKFGLTLWPSAFAAALISYLASTAVMWGAMAARSRASLRFSGNAIVWFAAAGVLNGSAVLLTYRALQSGSVTSVSTLVATFPLFTLALSAMFLRVEALTPRIALAIVTVVVGIATVVHTW